MPARADHPSRLGKGLEPVPAPVQVVKRAKEQHSVGALIRQVKVAGIGHRGLDAAVPSGRLGNLSDVQRHQVAMPHMVTELCEPQRVRAGSAADISHDRRRRRQAPQDDLLGALELERPERL